MKKRIVIHNILFRILVPPIYGVILYILILLIYDSLNQLSENFFSFEAILIVILTFLLFTGLRINILILDKKCPAKSNLKLRISLQFLLGFLFSITLVSIALSVYYKYLISFTSFTSELITFNLIFLLTAIFYNILYFSLLLLDLKNEEELVKENILKENLELELHSYKKEINPELFFGSLEALISLLKFEVKEADNYIQTFSAVYRYILDNRKTELVTLREELKYIDNFIYLLNVRFNNNINVSYNIRISEQSNNIIPCTIQRVLEYIVFSNIITHIHPLKIDISIEADKFVVINSTMNKKLKIKKSVKDNISSIKKAYMYYSNYNAEESISNSAFTIKLPLIKLEDIEELE